MTLFGYDPVQDAVDAALHAIERGNRLSERRVFDPLMGVLYQRVSQLAA